MRRLAPAWLGRLAGLALGVPVFLKIIGIVCIVAAIFGGLMSFQTMYSIKRRLQLEFESGSVVLARTLEIQLEKEMITEDVTEMKAFIGDMRRVFPELEYIILWDEEGRILAHSFSSGLPRRLARSFPCPPPREQLFRVFDSPKGLLYDRMIPVLKGRVGWLQVGVNTRSIEREMDILSHSIFGILCVAVLIGFILAFILTRMITRPVSHLVEVTHRIRDGDFAVRAEVLARDEVGLLADAMNEMTASLRDYREEVRDKEERLQRLINRIVEIQEQERLLISRELHDELGHAVLSLLLQLGTDQSAETQALRVKLQELVATIRRLAWGLRPSILDDYGLDSALEKFAEEQSKQSGIRFDYSYRRTGGGGRLPQTVEISLYRVVQEAVSNIVRYAKVDSASLSLIHEEARIIMLVEDAGVGFSMQDLKEVNQGLGLMGMKERVETIGGSFHLESSPGAGTIIQIEVPLKGLKTND